METAKRSVLTLNGGSSSIKFALYEVEESLNRLFSGNMEGIGTGQLKLNFTDNLTQSNYSTNIKSDNDMGDVNIVADWLEKQEGFDTVTAIGHRIVYGMKHPGPVIVNNELLDELKDIWAYDLEHLPVEIKLIEEFGRRHPALIQIACFDTSFHASMPPVAQMLPIPRRFNARGIKRYGFHGLSYAYLMDELTRTAHQEAQGRIILAHLGSGASMAAIKEGKSMDTSMGFTPTAGLLMGTRTGDLDPGLAVYLMKAEALNAEQLNLLINRESGLLGISETSSDMRDLLKLASTDKRAAEAIELFCYQAKKYIGSYAAVLNGLDTLVFSGGIGENAPEIRERICSDLQFLGIELDKAKNASNEGIISTEASKVNIRVIKTNEELMIARSVCSVLDYSIKN